MHTFSQLGVLWPGVPAQGQGYPTHPRVGPGGGERGSRGCVLEAGGPRPGEPVHRALCGQRSGVSSHRPWPRNTWQVAPGGVGGCPPRGSGWVPPPPQQTGMCLLLCPGVWSECPTQSRLCAEQAECSRAGMGSAQGRSVHITSTQRATRAAVHPCCRKPGTAGRGLGATLMLHKLCL